MKKQRYIKEIIEFKSGEHLSDEKKNKNDMKNNSGFGMKCPTTLFSPPVDAHES